MISAIKKFFARRKMRPTHFIYTADSEGYRTGYILMLQNEVGKRAYKFRVAHDYSTPFFNKKQMEIDMKHWIETGILPYGAKDILKEKLVE